MAGVRMGFAAETIDPPEISGITVTPSTSITGLSSRQVVFGSPTNGVAQNSSFLYDSTANSVLLGPSVAATSAASPLFAGLTRLYGAGDTFTFAEIHESGADVNFGPTLLLTRSRGVTTAPTPVQTGDPLGLVSFIGYAGDVGYTAGAQVQGLAAGNWTTGSFPANLVFLTNPASSAGAQERMRINSSGSVGIGTTAPTAQLEILASLTQAAFKLGQGTDANIFNFGFASSRNPVLEITSALTTFSILGGGVDQLKVNGVGVVIGASTAASTAGTVGFFGAAGSTKLAVTTIVPAAVYTSDVGAEVNNIVQALRAYGLIV